MRVTSAVLRLGSLALGQNEVDRAIREFHLGEYQSARKHLEGVLDKDPNNARARLFLALTRAAMGGCSAVSEILFREYSSNVSPELKRLAGIALASCIDSRLKTEHPADADVLYQTLITITTIFSISLWFPARAGPTGCIATKAMTALRTKQSNSILFRKDGDKESAPAIMTTMASPISLSPTGEQTGFIATSKVSASN
jgi:Tetratricopeptide repeat